MSHQRNCCLVSLGCSKNFVDSEFMAAILADHGLNMTSDPATAEIIIVNTCGFIESAKMEAIETILDLANYKDPEQGCCDYLIVTGCLAERYMDEVSAELPEVDAILGVRSYHAIAQAITDLDSNRRRSQALCYRSDVPSDALKHLQGERRHSTGSYAYLKIAEGCSRHCTYCAIPGIRGELQSRPIVEILEDAQQLIGSGVRELILVAQDTTSYGVDRSGQPQLTALLRALLEFPELKWIRILYMYADRFTDELLDLMQTEARILPYIDLPIQHASDAVLKRMGRPDTQTSLRQLIGKIRRTLPQVSLRTTVMVGFPGESESDVAELLDFIAEMRFDHLGCFIYSPEEGTAAARLPHRIDPAVSDERYARVMALQQQIAGEMAAKHLNSIYDVLLEDVSADGLAFTGRAWFQTPEADSRMMVYAQTADLQIGEWYPVKIIETSPYEYTGVTSANE